MMTVLDCAKEWLKLDTPIQSHRGDAHEKVSLLLVDEDSEDAPDASSLSQMTSLQPPV